MALSYQRREKSSPHEFDSFVFFSIPSLNSIRPVMMILKELMEDLNHQGPTIHQSTPGNICL